MRMKENYEKTLKVTSLLTNFFWEELEVWPIEQIEPGQVSITHVRGNSIVTSVDPTLAPRWSSSET